MEDIKLACRRLIEDNIKGDISDEVLELLTIAVMAIVLNKEEMAYKKLPEIFQNLNIYAEDKSVLDISHERLGNYSEDESLSKADAAATRSLHINDETGRIEEQLNLIISLTDIERKDTVNLIEKIVNGLIHLMRYGEIESNGSSLYIKDGISIITYDKNTGKLRKKHFALEGGIAQYYTIQSLEVLYNFLKNENTSGNQLLDKFKNEYESYHPSSYLLPVTIIEVLCDDQLFKELLDESFEEKKGPSKVALYYNDVLHDGNAFTFLSRQIESCNVELLRGNNKRTSSILELVKQDVTRFRKQAKTYKKP